MNYKKLEKKICNQNDKSICKMIKKCIETRGVCVRASEEVVDEITRHV